MKPILVALFSLACVIAYRCVAISMIETRMPIVKKIGRFNMSINATLLHDFAPATIWLVLAIIAWEATVDADPPALGFWLILLPGTLANRLVGFCENHERRAEVLAWLVLADASILRTGSHAMQLGGKRLDALQVMIFDRGQAEEMRANVGPFTVTLEGDATL